MHWLFFSILTAVGIAIVGVVSPSEQAGSKWTIGAKIATLAAFTGANVIVAFAAAASSEAKLNAKLSAINNTARNSEQTSENLLELAKLQRYLLSDTREIQNGEIDERIARLEQENRLSDISRGLNDLNRHILRVSSSVEDGGDAEEVKEAYLSAKNSVSDGLRQLSEYPTYDEAANMVPLLEDEFSYLYDDLEDVKRDRKELTDAIREGCGVLLHINETIRHLLEKRVRNESIARLRELRGNSESPQLPQAEPVAVR